MPADVYYGADCEIRVGLMADASTDPTAWFNLEFMSLTVNPTRERKARPKLGAPRHNALDPTKPVPGFFKLAAELVLDADTRQFARWLRLGLGAPTTTGPSTGIYTHVWASGSKTPVYFALQVRTASNKVRIYRGFTIAALSAQGQGEQTRDYDISVSLRGLTRERIADFLGDPPAAVPAEATAHRVVTKIDGVAASNTMSASWSFDRQVAEDAFMTPVAALSGIRPNGGVHSGQAQIRAIGDAFDDMEEADTEFAACLSMLGVVSGHEIALEHPHALLNPGALAIAGPALIERTFSWVGHQDATTPASRITIKNDVASYAT